MIGSIIYLQNQDIWLEVMQLNTETGDVKILKRSDEYEISGHYVKINNEFAMLYRKNRLLYLNVKNKEILLEDSNIKTYFDRIGKNNKFTICRGNDVLYSITYPSCRYDPINMADFDFNEDREEDQDFFLFVYNVLHDKDWQNRIYT